MSELDSSDNSHFLKTACWEACPRRSRLGEKNTPRRRGERFWTRRAAFSASKDTFPPRSTTSPDGGRLLRDYLCGLRRQARAPEHSDGHLVQNADRFYHARRVDLDDPAAIRPTVAATCRNMREEFGDILRVLLATGPHDKPVAASLTDAIAGYRRSLVAIARRLTNLRPCVTAWTSGRRLTSCGFISAIPASSLCATRTAGAANARKDGSAHERIGLYFEITRFVEGLGKSANA